MASKQVTIVKTATIPTIPLENVMESDREIRLAEVDADIGSLSPTTLQRLANRRLLFGQASSRNSTWYQDLVRETYDPHDTTFKPMAGLNTLHAVAEAPGLRAAAKRIGTTKLGFHPIVPRDSRSPRLRVPDYPLSPRESAYGIRAAKGHRRHDLGVMLNTGELPMATGNQGKQLAPIAYRTERRRPTAITQSGRVGIGRKGGIGTLLSLLQTPRAAEAGQRLKAAMAIQAVAEVEEHARFIVATGVHAAQPVVALLKTGDLEEKVAAAGILTRVCRVRDLQPTVSKAPALCDALYSLLQQHGHGNGNAPAMAACNVFAEIGRVPLVGEWAVGHPQFVQILIGHATATDQSPELAEAAAWVLASICNNAQVMQAVMAASESLPKLVATLHTPYIRAATASTALMHELACYQENLPALASAKPVLGILRVIRGSNGDRTALHSALSLLQRLSALEPIVHELITQHCPTVLLELLMYIKNQDSELLKPLLQTLRNLAVLPEYHVLLLHQGLVLQTLPILQWGDGALREITMQLLSFLAADPLCAANIVNAGGIPLLLVPLENEESPPLKIESLHAFGVLALHKENHVAISRIALPFILRQLAPSVDISVEAKSCEVLKGLVTTTEIKGKLLQTGLTQTLLDLVESSRHCPGGNLLAEKVTELMRMLVTDVDSSVQGVMQNGTVGDLGGLMQTSRMATTKAVKKYMAHMQSEWGRRPRAVVDWLGGHNRDKEEAAARVVAKLSINSIKDMLRAAPEVPQLLVRLLTTPQKNFQGVGASALANLAMAGSDVRKQLVDQGIVTSLCRMLHMQARTSWIPGTKLLQRLAADEECRKQIVNNGGVEGLLDILEHSPDEGGRIASVKALTTLAISSSCREIMTARGLKPIIDMLSDEVSSEYGQSVALRALQNFAVNEGCARAIIGKCLTRLEEYLKSDCLELLLGSGKLLRNLACHSNLDLDVAVVVLPQMVDLLYLEDIQVAQISCELLEFLSERAELQRVWIEMGIPDCLVKILLLGENPIKYYAGRVLERMGAGLSSALYERVKEARKFGPEYVAKLNRTKVAWGKLKADTKRLNVDFSSIRLVDDGREAEFDLQDDDAFPSFEATQQDFESPLPTARSHGLRSWNQTIDTLKDCGAIQFTPRPTKEEEKQLVRPSSARLRPAASSEMATKQRPWSASIASSPRSIASPPGSPSRRPMSPDRAPGSRPVSATSCSSSFSATSGSPTRRANTPTAPHPWGWEANESDGRMSRTEDEWNRVIGRSDSRMSIAMPNTPRVGSLAMMRPPTNNDITMPRTKRKAPALWRDIKGAMKMINLQNLVRARASTGDTSGTVPAPQPPVSPRPSDQDGSAGSGARAAPRVSRLVLPGSNSTEGFDLNQDPMHVSQRKLTGGEDSLSAAAMESVVSMSMQEGAETEQINNIPNSALPNAAPSPRPADAVSTQGAGEEQKMPFEGTDAGSEEQAAATAKNKSPKETDPPGEPPVPETGNAGKPAESASPAGSPETGGGSPKPLGSSFGSEIIDEGTLVALQQRAAEKEAAAGGESQPGATKSPLGGTTEGPGDFQRPPSQMQDGASSNEISGSGILPQPDEPAAVPSPAAAGSEGADACTEGATTGGDLDEAKVLQELEKDLQAAASPAL